MGNIKYYPENLQDKENYLWIHLKPYKLEYSNPSVLKGNLVSNIIPTYVNDDILAFLAPMEIMDNIGHTWESQENIITKLLGTFGAARQSMSLDTEVHQVNTALIYRSSERRKLDLLLNLSVYSNPLKDVFEPVNSLRKFSAPAFNESDGYTNKLKVTMPKIFKIQTKFGSNNVPLIDINYAALTAVQPYFKGPYIEGYPSHCELNLSFADVEHLSKGSFPDTSKVTVSGADQEPVRYTRRSYYGGYNF